MRKALTQCFRGYAAIAVVVAGFTALWALGIVEVSLPIVGYAWFAVAAAGTLVAIGMASRSEEVIELDSAEERIKAFEDATVTGRPFEGYLVALAMWAAVSFGWVLGGMSAAGLTVVGYGWLAIAAYGVVVGVGIVLNHTDDVKTAVDPSGTLETDADA